MSSQLNLTSHELTDSLKTLPFSHSVASLDARESLETSKSNPDKKNPLKSMFKDVMPSISSDKITGNCCLTQLEKRLPLIFWIRTYTMASAIGDLIAGISVGLVLIPQGIAYAVVADLPPQYGLFSSIMGCFLYCIFGTSPSGSNAPATLLALMTAIYAKGDIDVVIFQSFLGGIFIIAIGFFQLGFLIDFISVPVISGFASAASIRIASSQLKELLGVDLSKVERSQTGLGVIDQWVDTFGDYQLIRWQDAILGFCCLVFLFGFRALDRSNLISQSETSDATACQRFWNKLSKKNFMIVKKIVWVFCTGRNAVLIFLCIFIAYIVEPAGTACQETPEGCILTLTGDISSGLPSFELPIFMQSANSSLEQMQANSSLEQVQANSSLNTAEDIMTNFTSAVTRTDVSFGSMISNHMTGAIVIALIAILQNVSIAKSFAGSKGIDGNQEMLALGICNFAGSFIGSMIIGGSFSRCAVNHASGVKTPIGGLYSGIIVVMCLLFLMPACALIPKATLGAVVFAGVVFSIEYKIIKPIWTTKRADLFPGLSAFLVCLFFRLEVGIFVGVGIQMCGIIYRASRPTVEITIEKDSVTYAPYLLIIPHQSISFPSISHVRTCIEKDARKQATSVSAVIDCSKLEYVDFTAFRGIKAMMEDFVRRDQAVFWINMTEGVEKTLGSICKINK